jgi:hypothetical protein
MSVASKPSASRRGLILVTGARAASRADNFEKAGEPSQSRSWPVKHRRDRAEPHSRRALETGLERRGEDEVGELAEAQSRQHVHFGVRKRLAPVTPLRKSWPASGRPAAHNAALDSMWAVCKHPTEGHGPSVLLRLPALFGRGCGLLLKSLSATTASNDVNSSEQ